MRTTIDIEDDVLAAAKELARLQNVSAGQVVSKLMRQALVGQQVVAAAVPSATTAKVGFRPFASRGGVVTNDIVNTLCDREGV